MKPIPLLLALIAVAGLLLAAQPAQAQQRLAAIDLRKTFDSYWKTKQADFGLKDRAADLDKTRKTMVDDFQKAQDDYKKLLDSTNDQAVSAAERDKRKQDAEKKLLELREMQTQIEQFDRQSRSTLAETQRRLRDNILKEIRDKVAAKAKAKGFTAVIDIAAETRNETPVLLFHNGENDITDEIVAELNAGAPVPTAAPAPAAPAAGEKK
jgi:Skp family chaperone for outer membrane proteins